MARVTKKSKAQVNKQLWNRSNNSHRQQWQTISQKGYDFYLNEQLTKDELTMLQESGMPSFTINRITPIIEIMKYFVTANNPKFIPILQIIVGIYLMVNLFIVKLYWIH